MDLLLSALLINTSERLAMTEHYRYSERQKELARSITGV